MLHGLRTGCPVFMTFLSDVLIERLMMIEFDGVVPALKIALSKRGYTKLTPVQEAVIAPNLMDTDALVSAQTGSGKTVAFGLALASTLLGDKEKLAFADKPLGLVIAPTRELALQVKKELDWLYQEAGATIISCVGGMDARSERRALERGAHIVVGTPGRLCDHIRRNGLDVSDLKAVVLDEADEMLDLGFREELEFILESTPEERRTLLFSATVPTAIAKLAKRYQRDAVRVKTVMEEKQHVDIEYRVLTIAPREQENAIINVLRYYEADNALVFCNTRASVNRMMARLHNRGFSVVALSGELSQTERSHALQALRDGRARVCIATDVAARGIDLPKLDLVIHAELPTNPEILLHRSGRTGRAGRKGISALIADAKAKGRAQRLLRMAKIEAMWAAPPSVDDVIQRDEERILADPALSEPERADEEDFVNRLLAGFSQRQVATAFLRLSKAGKSAPEELQEVQTQAPKQRSFDEPDRSNTGRGRGDRRDFAESVWVSLSVGRKQNAEPRWLIPMICKSTGLTKSSIGSIIMQQDETFVEFNADHADALFATIGKNKTLERNIRVKQLDGAPQTDDKPRSKPRHKPDSRKPKRHKAQDDGGTAGEKFAGKKPRTRKNKDNKPGVEGGAAPQHRTASKGTTGKKKGKL